MVKGTRDFEERLERLLDEMYYSPFYEVYNDIVEAFDEIKTRNETWIIREKRANFVLNYFNFEITVGQDEPKLSTGWSLSDLKGHEFDNKQTVFAVAKLLDQDVVMEAIE